MEKDCEEFLRRFDFARLEWDGNEFTAYTAGGEPWGAREFTRDTATRIAFDNLGKQYKGAPPFSVEVN